MLKYVWYIELGKHPVQFLYYTVLLCCMILAYMICIKARQSQSFVYYTPQSTGSDGIETKERESHIFSEEGKDEDILSMALTQEFLIYSTQVRYHMYMYVRVYTWE